MQASIEDLTAKDDIGEIIADSIYQFFREEQTIDLINRLKEAGVNTTSLEKDETDNRFEKMTFVLTGALEKYSREQASDIIEKFGGKVTEVFQRKQHMY